MKILSPYYFELYSKWILIVASVLMCISLPLGLYYGLYASPIDYQQGEMVRIMYLHVPLAWLSLGLYSMIAILSAINIIWKIQLAYIIAVASIPVGTIFAFLTLITGSIWGKPIWGTYWVWDARLTSMLVLFMFYLSQTLILKSGESLNRIQKPLCVISLIGFINVPIVKFSVDIWASLHQPASIIRSKGIAVHPEMLKPLALCAVSLILYTVIVITLKTKTLINRTRLGARYD